MGTRWRQGEIRAGFEWRKDPEREKILALQLAAGAQLVGLQEVEELVWSPTSQLNTF